MELLSAIGIILGVFIIIFLSVKGIHILIAAPLSAIIVVLMNQMNLVETIFGSGERQFMGALGTYIINFFAIFLLGSLLAKYMEESGATVSIAEAILKAIGTEKPYRTLVSVFIVSFILTYGGISIFVVMFAVIPLVRTIFKKLNLSWNLIQVPFWLGASTISMTIMPGTPAIHNVIPMRFLGTSLIAAPFASIIAAIGCTVFGLIYMKYTLNKSLAKGETYATYTIAEDNDHEKKETPSFLASITPLVTLITLAIVGSAFGNEFWQANIIFVALVSSILLSGILFRNYVPSQTKVLNIGANGAIAPVFATASAVAFGSVVMGAPGFDFFSHVIMNIPGSPLISLSVLTSSMATITGSASGALGIVMPTFSEYFLATGVNPELIHRVAAISAGMGTQVPQSGVLLTFLALTKLNYKNGYKEGLITIAGGSFIALVIVLLLG